MRWRRRRALKDSIEWLRRREREREILTPVVGSEYVVIRISGVRQLQFQLRGKKKQKESDVDG